MMSICRRSSTPCQPGLAEETRSSRPTRRREDLDASVDERSILRVRELSQLNHQPSNTLSTGRRDRSKRGCDPDRSVRQEALLRLHRRDSGSPTIVIAITIACASR